MELETIIQYADSLSVIVIVLYMWSREAKRADRLEDKLITTLEIKDRGAEIASH